MEGTRREKGEKTRYANYSRCARGLPLRWQSWRGPCDDRWPGWDRQCETPRRGRPWGLCTRLPNRSHSQTFIKALSVTDVRDREDSVLWQLLLAPATLVLLRRSRHALAVNFLGVSQVTLNGRGKLRINCGSVDSLLTFARTAKESRSLTSCWQPFTTSLFGTSVSVLLLSLSLTLFFYFFPSFSFPAWASDPSDSLRDHHL